MSAWSARHRIAGAVIAGFALTIAPTVTLSASAIAPPAPPSGLRVDTSVPQSPGTIKIRWTDSPDTGVSEYLVRWTYENELTASDYVNETDTPTFTIPDVDPGESIDIEVEAVRDEVRSTPAQLRATGLDTKAPNYVFTDTPGNTFTYEISWLSTAGITTGYAEPAGSRSFAPSAPVLREQMAAFLYRLGGSPPVELPATSPFTDVPSNATFYQEIVWLAQRNISTGYAGPHGTKTFRPSDPVLREQMAAFLLRFNGVLVIDDGQATFTDVPPTATFFISIEWLAGQGISTGYAGPNGSRTFRPSDPVLREQMAAFLYRYETGKFGQNIDDGPD